MASLFFRLLSTDLQIDILHGWLNDDSNSNLLRTLAALDIACCCQAGRDQFLSLVQQIPAFGAAHTNGREIKLIGNYVQWLDSRKAAVRAMVLAGTNEQALDELLACPLLLPSVECIHWKGNFGCIKLAQALLLSCPNLISVDSEVFLTFTAEVVAKVPKLQHITISKYIHASVDSLTLIGPQLLGLRVKGREISTNEAAAISRACPCLQTLEITVPHRAAAILAIVELFVTACKGLQDLCLAGGFLGLDAVKQLLANKRLRRFAVTSPTNNDDYLLASAMELRPDMEYLQFGRSQPVSKGVLQVKGVNATLLARVLDIRSAVHTLLLDGYLRDDVARLVAARLSGLLSVSFRADSCEPVETLLAACGPSLKSFKLIAQDMVPAAAPYLIAAHCPLLESLTLVFEQDESVATDDGMSAIFAACPHLKELTLKRIDSITSQALQAILDHKLHLKTLRLLSCGFYSRDAVWFRERARECQVLPVPEIVSKEV